MKASQYFYVIFMKIKKKLTMNEKVAVNYFVKLK